MGWGTEYAAAGRCVPLPHKPVDNTAAA